MDLTPLVPAGRQIIERYAAAGFRVSGVVYDGPVLVFADRTVAWEQAAGDAISTQGLSPVIEHGDVEILLVGLGRRMAGNLAALAPLRVALKSAGIVIEPMDTGAACRTYNVLIAEDRRVAAALLPPV